MIWELMRARLTIEVSDSSNRVLYFKDVEKAQVLLNQLEAS